MINSIYGKWLENVFRYSNSEILSIDDNRVTTRDLRSNRVLNAEITNNLIFMEKSKKYTELNKFPFIGFAILELSKLDMINFYYDLIKPKFQEFEPLPLYQDTDSFFILFDEVDIDDKKKKEELEQIIWENKDQFDLSDIQNQDSLLFKKIAELKEMNKDMDDTEFKVKHLNMK